MSIEGGHVSEEPQEKPSKAERMIAERKAGRTVATLASKYGVSTASVTNYVNRAKRRRYRK